MDDGFQQLCLLFLQAGGTGLLGRSSGGEKKFRLLLYGRSLIPRACGDTGGCQRVGEDLGLSSGIEIFRVQKRGEVGGVEAMVELWAGTAGSSRIWAVLGGC